MLTVTCLGIPNLHFTITVQPAGSNGPLHVKFEDRFAVRRR